MQICQAYINNQTTVVVTEDIETEEENPLSKVVP